MWLVYVEGKSGSGKSKVSKYIESKMGFARHETDRDLKRGLLCEGSGSIGLGDIYHALPYGEDFWQRFWSERGKHAYTYESAREVVSRHRFDIKAHLLIPDEESFHLAYVIWNEFFIARDASLQNGNNVVLDSLVGRTVRQNNFRSDSMPPQLVERYLIRLHVDDETAIQRKMKQHDWHREKAEMVVLRHRKFDYSPLLPPGVSDEPVVEDEFHLDGIGTIPYVEYRSYDEDLPVIQEDLRRRFS